MEPRKSWIAGKYGAKLDPRLPVTIDSIRVKPSSSYDYDCVDGYQYIAKPPRMPGWRERIRHSWYILTGRAFAIQFSEDHLRMAKRK